MSSNTSGRPARIEGGIGPWLKKAPVFSSLGDEEIGRVASDTRAYLYRKGEKIFEKGKLSGALFVVVSGMVHIVKEEGPEYGGDPARPPENPVIAEFVPGDSFGELELFTSSPRNATALADSDAVLLMFPRKGLMFGTAIARNPAVSAQILNDFLKTVAGRIRSANAIVKDNSPLIQELKRQVYGDKLTGLYNKTYLEESLPDMVKEPKRPLGLLMFKPDNFKEINDTFGHESGDEVLRLMAAALAKSVGEKDTAARYMGNELAVVLPGRDRAGTLEEARKVLRLMNGLDISKATKGSGMRISLSIGAAVCPDHACTAADLIAKAHALPLVGRARGGNLILFPEDAQ